MAEGSQGTKSAPALAEARAVWRDVDLGRSLSRDVTPLSSAAGSLSVKVMHDYLVLFLGRANAGRTLMAEASASRWGSPGFMAVSAGLEPGAEIDPGAEIALRAELHATAHGPRLLSDLIATLDGKVDLVITLDPIESEPGVPGHPPVLHWDLDDPRRHSCGEKDRLRSWHGVLRDLDSRIKLMASLLPQGLDEFVQSQRAQDVAREAGRPGSMGM